VKKEKIFETPDLYLVVKDKYSNSSDFQLIEQKKFIMGLRAQIASEMVIRFGMVAAEDNGEDSAGRQSVIPAAPKDVVERAVTTADFLVSEFEARGWLDKLPHPNEVYGFEEKET
jgi:hypothetical protein